MAATPSHSTSLEEDNLSQASSRDTGVEENSGDDKADAQPQDSSKKVSAAAPAEAMKENPFDSEGSRILFDAMDQIQSCIGNLESVEIDVPQLVICGNQSAGKSSLLQGLTSVPFPADTSCCTRFATRIVSRRTSAGSPNSFKISIVEPDIKIKGFGYPVSAAYKEFSRTGKNLSPEEFKKIMKEVSTKYMGIAKGRGPNKKNFATEVLKIELSGPSRSHFSIVDVPGIFTNDTAVNPGEMEGVTDMVLKYMQAEKNIVICVADAMTDLANQGTFMMAAEHVQRQRLVTVFTKCDLQPDPREVVALVTGQREDTARSLGAECFVVRNPLPGDPKDADRDQLESTVFNKSPWDQIPEVRRGSSQLRRYLSRVLCNEMCEKFPAIQAGITQRLDAAQRSRHALGPTRTTPQDMDVYLRGVIKKYEDFSVKTLEKPGQLAKHMRLRERIKDNNEAFARSMKREGHFLEFENPDMDVRAVLAQSTAQFQKTEQANLQSAGSLHPPQPHVFFANTPPVTPPSNPDTTKSRNKATAEPIFRYIQETSRSYQSTQLPGLINPDVLPDLFQHQTQKWPQMARSHLTQMASEVKQTYLSVLHEICPPDEGNKILHDELLKELERSHKHTWDVADDEIKTYCERERTNQMQTTDPRFIENLRALRTIRLLESLGSLQGGPGTDVATYFDRLHYSIGDNMTKDVHDVLKVYYQISMEGFIRYITQNIIEHFVNSPLGPLRGLSREWVSELDQEALWRFGREDDWTLAERKKYDEIISRLQRAHEITQTASVKMRYAGVA